MDIRQLEAAISDIEIGAEFTEDGHIILSSISPEERVSYIELYNLAESIGYFNA